MSRQEEGWIGVDLDGTLAHYEDFTGGIGAPIPRMVQRIHRWLAEGREVRIVTARASHPECIIEEFTKQLHDWLADVGLPPLKVQCHKDFAMIELWDDRAIHVINNTGVPNAGQRSRVDGAL